MDLHVAVRFDQSTYVYCSLADQIPPVVGSLRCACVRRVHGAEYACSWKQIAAKVLNMKEVSKS